MLIIIAGLVIGKAVGIHVVNHVLGHRGAGITGLGVSLGLPCLVKQIRYKLLLVLSLGNGVHLVHGLSLGGFGQLQLQLGKHELQARGRAKLSKRNRRRAAYIIYCCHGHLRKK